MPPSRAGICQSSVCLRLHVYKKKNKNKKLAERNHRLLLNAVLLWRFRRKVHFTAEKWTVQSIYAKQVLDFFLWFFFFQFQQVLLLVACLLTQLTFCVSALYMSSALYYCFGSNFSGWDGFLPEGYVWIVPTNRFVYRAGDCVPNSEWTFVFFMENLNNMDREDDGREMRTHKKIKNKRRRIPGSFWWSCFRLHNYSIWCAICDSWMFLVYLCSLHPTREKKNRRVTKCYNNAIDLVLILFNIISINNCCLPPSERPFGVSVSLSLYILAHLHKVNERKWEKTMHSEKAIDELL